MAKTTRTEKRQKRKVRIRKSITGTAERPRLSVFRSPRHIYAQVINDETGHTLASVHSYANKGDAPRANKDACNALGKKLAEVCKSKKIEKVVFDKNGFAYHGRVKALAEGAREAGLQF